MKDLNDKKDQRSKECLFVYAQFKNFFVRDQILGQIHRNHRKSKLPHPVTRLKINTFLLWTFLALLKSLWNLNKMKEYEICNRFGAAKLVLTPSELGDIKISIFFKRWNLILSSFTLLQLLKLLSVLNNSSHSATVFHLKILKFWYLRVPKELEQISQHQIDCKFHALSFYWGFRAIWGVPRKFRAKMCSFSSLSTGVVARIWADFDEFAPKSGREQKSSWIVRIQRDILLTSGLFYHQDHSWKCSGKIGFAPESDSKQSNSWENFFRYGISRRSGDTYLELVRLCIGLSSTWQISGILW